MNRLIGDRRLKRITNDALQATKSLTVARTGGKWTSYNLRAIATLFEAVTNHLRQVADEMDKINVESTGPIADSRPERCTFRLQEQGQPYPRSGCWHKCGRKRGSECGNKPYTNAGDLDQGSANHFDPSKRGFDPR